MNAKEWNFDGLIGPSHNYAGLSFGNLASSQNAMMVSKPKAAALQGISKMAALADMGLKAGFLPPHERPYLPALRQLGFTGTDRQIIKSAARSAPELLANCYSASAMWTANAATVSPSADSKDGRVHFTPANLSSMFHRSIEADFTGKILKAIFFDDTYFSHHNALPAGSQFADEGAANHNRFWSDYGNPGFQLFVFGRYAFRKGLAPWKYPARQTFEASRAIARLHELDPKRTMFIQQHPSAIDAGAFHNDVVAVANRNVLFYHEKAFEDPAALQEELWARAEDIDFHFLEVPNNEVSLEDAVKSYLFNSQLVSMPGKAGEDGGMALILPMEARETESTRRYLERLAQGNHPICKIEFFDVRQSMRNGGGPACLRLRVVLTDDEAKHVKKDTVISKKQVATLQNWVEKHYRDELAPADLADPRLMDESYAALDELTQILNLGSIYQFQR